MRLSPESTTTMPPFSSLNQAAVSARSASIAFIRVFVGLFWLYEVTIGHHFKIGFFGLFGLDANPGWIGSDAGAAVIEHGTEAIELGTWGWYQWALESVIMPNAAAFAVAATVLQIVLAIMLVLGAFVRPLVAISLAMELTIYFLGNSRIPPFFTAGSVFLLVTAAGQYHGVDAVLSRRLVDARSAGARAVQWLIDLPLYRPQFRVGVTAVLVLLAGYFLMQIPVMATQDMSLVALELAVVGGIVALGVFLSDRVTDRLALAASMLRVFVGYKFLHEIFTRLEPGVNALPGFAGVEAQRETFETVAAGHLTAMSSFIDSVILPALPLWVAVFAIVQLAVGVALLIGWRTRLASAVGIGYLSVLLLLGMTRLVPFLLLYMLAVYALDAGRQVSVSRFREAMRPARYGLPISGITAGVLAGIAAASLVVAAVAGVEIDGYATTVGGVTAAMVAMFAGTLALYGWLQRDDSKTLWTSAGEENQKELAEIR
jgi:uncharacterized membrane protein YphA (DoxX/SURF4 family)